MKVDKGANQKEIFKLWKERFYESLLSSIYGTLGYAQAEGLIRRAKFDRKDQSEYISEEIKAIEKFHYQFIRMCQRNRILKRFLLKKKSRKDRLWSSEQHTWEPDAGSLPINLVENARKFNLYLEGLVKFTRKKRWELGSTRSRVRVPSKIAEDLIFILESFKGKKLELDDVKKFLEPRGEAERKLNVFIKEAKEDIKKLLSDDIVRLKGRIADETKGDWRSLHHFQDHIKDRRREIDELERTKINWDIFKYRGDEGTQWANHLKEHLIRVLTSMGSDKIKKKVLKKEKEKLIEKILKKDVSKPVISLWLDRSKS